MRWLTQNDRASLDALIERLDAKDDPRWLRTEIMATLVTLTGKRFSWNASAWQEWWKDVRATWPSD